MLVDIESSYASCPFGKTYRVHSSLAIKLLSTLSQMYFVIETLIRGEAK